MRQRRRSVKIPRLYTLNLKLSVRGFEFWGFRGMWVSEFRVLRSGV